jgi:HD-GYP domain-containing protein (c-di-GMP phosphodiesterase class II)
MRKCLESFSLALDFVESDYLKINLHHSRRVAYISLNIAKAMGLSQDEQKDLFALSLLHDNGLAYAGSILKEDITVNENYSKEIQRDNLILAEELFKKYELMPEHCREGEKNLRLLPLSKHYENVIMYHHESYNGTGIFKIAGDDIPLFSQIIRLSDVLDISFDLTKIEAKGRRAVIQSVIDNKNKIFSPDAADAFLSFSHKERFWADLSFYNIAETLNRMSPKIYYEFSWDDVIHISETMMNIIDSKSKFTYRHSKGITEKIDLMSEYYNFDKEKKLKMHIAANLHDLGKLNVPNSILEKPGRLDESEFYIVKRHPYYTKLALDKIPNFEDISNWAANHHEKLNGEGYPENLIDKELDFESKLMAVIDIYQALTEERPYRPVLSHKKAMGFIFNMANENLIDKDIAKDVDEVIYDAAKADKKL